MTFMILYKKILHQELKHIILGEWEMVQSRNIESTNGTEST